VKNCAAPWLHPDTRATNDGGTTRRNSAVKKSGIPSIGGIRLGIILWG
jgi:hypothetical protein